MQLPPFCDFNIVSLFDRLRVKLSEYFFFYYKNKLEFILYFFYYKQ